MKYFSYFKSPVGFLEVVADNKNILSIRFVKKLSKNNSNALSQKCVVQLNEYFSGQRKKFDLPIKLSATIWQNLVWQKLSQIPYGNVISYQDLAQMCGKPQAARAVGQALNKNKLPIILPCHRVLSASGDLGGYQAGLTIKKQLLALEQAFD